MHSYTRSRRQTFPQQGWPGLAQSRAGQRPLSGSSRPHRRQKSIPWAHAALPSWGRASHLANGETSSPQSPSYQWVCTRAHVCDCSSTHVLPGGRAAPESHQRGPGLTRHPDNQQNGCFRKAQSSQKRRGGKKLPKQMAIHWRPQAKMLNRSS